MRIVTAVLLAVTLLGAVRADSSATDLERRVQALVEDERVTIVRFWAPWCGNCRAEMAPEGWAKFIAANPEVQFVFIAIWHRDQPVEARLADAALGDQPNLTLLRHPNPASRSGERLDRFLDLPVTWIPTTWVFREGRLRFAFNYGEIRFPLLQQFVDDARAAWRH